MRISERCLGSILQLSSLNVSNVTQHVRQHRDHPADHDRCIVIFATGVLTIPSAMYTLGAFPGAINVLGWQGLNTWCALVQGQFRNNHPGCHSIADMGQLVGGRIVKEITGVLFLVAFIIVGASGMVGVSTALNALSNHSLCTNYFSIIAAIMVGLCASVRKFEKIAWITWAGFASVFIAVFIVV